MYRLLLPYNVFNDLENDTTNLILNCYTNLSFEKALNPGTVTANCFAVTDNSGKADVLVTDAVFEPVSNTVTLHIKAEGLTTFDCSAILVAGNNFGLSYINSAEEVKLANTLCELTPIYKGELYDISVMGIKIYDASGKIIVSPVANTPFSVKVSVVNGTGTELTRTLSLYKNSTLSDAIATQNINLNGYTAGEFTFDISAMEWLETDKIIAVIK